MTATKRTPPKSGPAARLKKRRVAVPAPIVKATVTQVAPRKTRFASTRKAAHAAWCNRRTVTIPVLLWLVLHFLAAGVRESRSTTWWLALAPLALCAYWSTKVDPRDVSQYTVDDLLQRKSALRDRPKQKNRMWFSSSTRVAVAGFGVVTALWMIVPVPMIGRISVALMIELAVLLSVIELRVRRFGSRPVATAATIGPVEVWNSSIGRFATPGVFEDVMKPDPTTGEMKKYKVTVVPAKEAGKLPGSTLIDFTRLNAASWTAVMVGVKGKQGAAELRASVNTIAGVYGINPDWVEVQETGDYSQPRLIVTEKATLARSQPWHYTGIREDGAVEMGNYPDGSRACIQAYVPGQGVRHIWWTAGSGGGKTGAVNSYLGQVMPSGMWVLDLVDLGETSLPAWVEHSFRYGDTPEDAYNALVRAVAVMKGRMAAMKRMTFTDRDGSVHTGVSTLEVSKEWPVWMVMIEEWQVLVSDPVWSKVAMPLADTLGRLGRKYGVQLGIVSQGASLEVVFGKAMTLRTNIQTAGNVVALKADQTASGMAMGGTISINLGRIPPKQPGLGFVVGPANYRDVMCRMDWNDDAVGRPDDIPSSWKLAEAAVPGTPNPVDLASIAEVDKGVVEEAEQIALEAASPQLSSVEKAALELLGPELLGELTLAQIASATAQTMGVNPLDKEEFEKHYDRVRKQLEKSTVLVKAGRGKWTAGSVA